MIRLPLLAIFATLLLACQSRPKLTTEEEFFVREIKPVLEKNCLRCHNGAILPGKLDLSSRATALRTDDFIIPGNHKASLLAQAIGRQGNHPKLMPKLELSLTDMQIGAICEWIDDGAAWPKGSAGNLKHHSNHENP